MNIKNIEKLNEAIVQLDDTSSGDTFVETWNQVENLIVTLKEMKNRLEEKFVQYLRTNGSYTIDNVTYSATKSSTTKQTIPSFQLIQELLSKYSKANVFDCLSANAFKYGAVRKLLETDNRADQYDVYFTTTVNQGVSEKVARQSLIKSDDIE